MENHGLTMISTSALHAMLQQVFVNHDVDRVKFRLAFQARTGVRALLATVRSRKIGD